MRFRFSAWPMLGLCIFSTSSLGQVFPWARAYGGPDSETINDCDRGQSGFFLAGFTNSVGMGGLDLWVAKLTERGAASWQVAIGGAANDQAHEVVATSDGGCIAAGQTNSFGAGGNDGWIVKLDANGVIEWQKTYGGRGSEGFTTIAASPRGYYVGGSVNFQEAEQDAWVLEIDPTGTIIWQEFFDNNKTDWITSIAPTPDGLVFVANSNSDFLGRPSNIPFFRPWLVRLDPDGGVRWSKTYNMSGGDMWNHISTTRDGGFVATGEILAAAFFRGDFWIVRLDGAGTPVWDQRFGDNFGFLDADIGGQVRETLDGGFLAVGSTNTGGAGSQDAWLVKVDSNGQHLWNKTYGTSGFDSANAMALGDSGQVLVAGTVQIVSPEPFDGLAMLVESDGSLLGHCGLSGEGEPNIWTTELEIDVVVVSPTPTAYEGVPSNAVGVAFNAQSMLCGPPQLKMMRR